MNLWIIDTETASLKGGIVEFAALNIDEQLNVLREVHSRVNPERPIDPGAYAIHGISDEDVKDAPTFAQLIGVQNYPVDWIGHNVAFDKRMCDPVLTPSRELCTLKLARQYIKGTTNHKLETIKRELGFPDQKSHSALGDCYTTRDLLKHILSIAGVPLEALFQRAAMPRMLNFMPWGEHKGKPMLKVPSSYRAWLLQLEDIDSDLRYTLEKLKHL
jgi:exodeoxyribonuclease X